MPYPEHLREQVDAYLVEVRFADEADLGGLVEAMRYSLLAPGQADPPGAGARRRRSRSAATRPR